MQVFGKNRREIREIKGRRGERREREMIIFFLSLVWFAQKWKKEKKRNMYNTLLINPTIIIFSSLSLFPPNLEENNMVGHEGK